MKTIRRFLAWLRWSTQGHIYNQYILVTRRQWLEIMQVQQ